MQANDMLRSYDDRDDWEIRQHRLVMREVNSRTFILTMYVDDLDRGIVLSRGTKDSVFAAYVRWFKLTKQSQATNLVPIRFTIRDGHGIIQRSFTTKG